MAKTNDITQVDPKLLAEINANLSKIPTTDLVLFNQCHSALYWGGDWALIGADCDAYRDVAAVLTDVQTNARYKNVATAVSIKGGILLRCQTNWLLQHVIGTLAPSYANQNGGDFLARARDVAEKEGDRFNKYWQKTLDGKTEMFEAKDKKGNARATGTIGVYNTNVNNSVTVNGIDYPAFKLPVDAMLKLIANAPNANRIYVLKHTKGKSTWAPLKDIIQTNAYASVIEFPQGVSHPSGLLLRLAVK